MNKYKNLLSSFASSVRKSSVKKATWKHTKPLAKKTLKRIRNQFLRTKAPKIIQKDGMRKKSRCGSVS
jgi:hypothetical protein